MTEEERSGQRRFEVSVLAREFSGATGDVRELVQLVALRLAQLVGDGCAVRFVLPSELEFIGSVSYRDPEAERRARALLSVAPGDVPESIADWVASSGVSQQYSEASPEALATKIHEPYQSLVRELRIHSILAVPLCVGETVVGVATLCRIQQAGAYSDAERRQVEDVAIHAALAMTNARLLSEMKSELAERVRVERRMRTLTQLTRELAEATSDAQQLLRLVSRRLGELIGESCVIRLLEVDDIRRHGPGALYHDDPDITLRLQSALTESSERPYRGLSAQVQASGRAVILSGTTDELAAQVHPSFAEVLRERGCSSLLSAPIRTAGRVIGVVTMRRSTGFYTADELAFVEEILDHAALAIDNSRLLESMRRELAERERTEEALRRAEQQFRQAQKMEAIGRLAAGVAHDFNNLLSVILSCATIVREQLAPADPNLQDIDQIEIAATRAADLTHQLLAFSRAQVLRSEVLDLNLVVREVEGMVRRLVNEDIVIRSELAQQAMTVKVDRGHLSQVLMNLAINARDAMPNGGLLSISTRLETISAGQAEEDRGIAPGEYVVLSIQDSGSGMDEATRQQIFEPFFTTKERGKGTGLGLSTVLGIVQQSGGGVSVDSEPGAGATFNVFLPCAAEGASPAVGDPAALHARGGSILLVEDDAQVRQVSRRILERNGYTVWAAPSGPEALALFEERGADIDLLVTDIVMPQMGGRELAARLCARRSDLRVLYMTGYAEGSILDARNSSAGTDLLQKPFSAEELLNRVRELRAS